MRRTDYDVLIDAEGCGRQLRPWEYGDHDEDMRWLLRPAATLDGTLLTPAGQPLTRARVEVTVGELRLPGFLSDDHGRFRVERLPVGAYDLALRWPDSVPEPLGHHVLEEHSTLDLGPIRTAERGSLALTLHSSETIPRRLRLGVTAVDLPTVRGTPPRGPDGR